MFDVDRFNVYWLTWVLLRGLHTVDIRSSNPNHDAKIRRSDCALRIKWQVFLLFLFYAEFEDMSVSIIFSNNGRRFSDFSFGAVTCWLPLLVKIRATKANIRYILLIHSGSLTSKLLLVKISH